MTPKQILRKQKSIRSKVDKLHAELSSLQNICEHSNVTKKYCGSGGHYDPSNNGYWIEWRCPDCDKFWITEQDRENLLKPGRVI